MLSCRQWIPECLIFTRKIKKTMEKQGWKPVNVWGMLGLGSTPDPEGGITGFLITVITGLVIPNYCFCPGLGSGLEIHCFNTNGSISGVTRAALLQQENRTSTEHPWNNSEQGMVSFFHPALRGLWEPSASGMQKWAGRRGFWKPFLVVREQLVPRALRRKDRCICTEFDFSTCDRPWGSVPLIFSALIAQRRLLKEQFPIQSGKQDGIWPFSLFFCEGGKKMQFLVHLAVSLNCRAGSYKKIWKSSPCLFRWVGLVLYSLIEH